MTIKKTGKSSELLIYCAMKKSMNSLSKFHFEPFDETGRQAIVAFLDGLYQCYTIGLEKGLIKGKSIAFTVLSIDYGLFRKDAAHETVKATINFIKKNSSDDKKKYKKIYFYEICNDDFITYQERLYIEIRDAS